jgi:hypothetical protein
MWRNAARSTQQTLQVNAHCVLSQLGTAADRRQCAATSSPPYEILLLVLRERSDVADQSEAPPEAPQSHSNAIPSAVRYKMFATLTAKSLPVTRRVQMKYHSI